MKCYGTCISLTNFGAYIDIGSECDGLLHVTQMHTTSTSDTVSSPMQKGSTARSTFINHPKQIVQPGDEILVTIRSINPTRKKLHLTLLPWDVVQEQLAIELETKALKRAQARAFDNEDDNNENEDSTSTSLTISYSDRIPLSDVQVDDELWGEIKRVTDFGAYVEVGAIVDGFLHYMDHPSFTYEYNKNHQQPIHPTSIMQQGDRVRVWVSDIDPIRNRIKLTAHRPSHLPGPRREL
jgi:ribosomal protein S1